MNHHCESCKRPLVTPGHCSTCIADLTREGGYQEYDTETGRYAWVFPKDTAHAIRRETHKIGDLEHTVETMTPATDLADLQQEIFEWANEHYPERTYHNAMTKLVMEEVPEVLRHPSDPMEWADVFILMIDAAKLQGVDIAKAVREKMAINRRRTWAVDPSTGVMRHVRGAWAPLTGTAQILAGDLIRFDLGKEKVTHRVAEVLNYGTDEEEIVYDAERNHYFITVKATLGTSSARNVEILRDGK